MQTIGSRMSGILEVLVSVIGAVLLITQTISGADGMSQIATALVTLVAPICGAIRETQGRKIIDQATAIADAVRDGLGQPPES